MCKIGGRGWQGGSRGGRVCVIWERERLEGCVTVQVKALPAVAVRSSVASSTITSPSIDPLNISIQKWLTACSVIVYSVCCIPIVTPGKTELHATSRAKSYTCVTSAMPP